MRIHLSDDQICAFLKKGGCTSRIHLAGKGEEEDAARLHLETCEECLSRLRAQESMMDSLSLLRFNAFPEPGPECPAAEIWVEVVAGIDPEQAELYLSHATHCDYCGPYLREAVADLASEVTQEEKTRIARLPSAGREGRRRLAQIVCDQSSGTMPRQPAPRYSWLRQAFSTRSLAFAIPATALAICCFAVALHWQRARSPEALIAAAYGEHRTLEARIEGAPYGALRLERGGSPERERMARPALLRAEAEIAERLRSDPEDVRWLQASGRASLLEGDSAAVEQALAVLLKAQELAPTDAAITVDTASAYLLRGEIEKRREDVAEADNLLGSVLASNPNNDVAVYNDALAQEALGLKRTAIESWQRFLNFRPNSPWAVDARRHLDQLQEQVNRNSRRSTEPLLGMEQVASAFATGSRQEIDRIDSRIEEYQTEAVEHWLPSYFPAPSSVGSPDQALESPAGTASAREAVTGLAHLLLARHGDGWLTDMMSAHGSVAATAEAIGSLGASESLISKSDDRGAQDAALLALQLFERAHWDAGAMRARLDLVYIRQLQHQSYQCQSSAQALAAELRPTSYAWARVQDDLEQAACASTCDARELQLAEQARSSALAHGFAELAMRAAVFAADSYQIVGDRHRAWEVGSESLQQFWDGQYEPRRGYSVLDNFSNLADEQAKWFLQRDVLEEEQPLAGADPNIAVRAIAIGRLGEAQLRSGDTAEAKQSFRAAQQVFMRVPAGIRRDALNAEMELDLAEAESKSNHADDAWSRVERVRPIIAQMPDDDLRLQFFRTSGMAAIQTGREAEARNDLHAAVRLAEHSLAMVKTDADRWRWKTQNEAQYRALVTLDLKSNPQLALREWEAFKALTLNSNSADAANQPDALASFNSLSPSPSHAGDGLAPVLVSYFLTPEATVAWVSDETGVHEVPLSLAGPSLSPLVRRFLEQCSDPSSSQPLLRQESSELYARLIEPLATLLNGHRNLILEPDGILRNIPFEALLDDHQRYLGDQFEVTVSPGIEYLNRTPRLQPVSTASKVLIVADPDAAGATPLPEAGQEAESISAMFMHPRLMLHFSGSGDDVLTALASADVFHFAGHATATVQSAGLSIGAAGAASPFNPRFAAPLRTRLAVLAACSSSLGTDGHFDDEDSLVRRLMAARVPSVVASHWAVDSDSTAVLMKGFYSRLIQGRTVSSSLALARRDLRSEPRYSHPYYWAAFSDFGKS